jgi:hypothetical protein
VTFLQGLGKKCSLHRDDLFQPIFHIVSGLNSRMGGPAKDMKIKQQLFELEHRKW